VRIDSLEAAAPAPPPKGEIRVGMTEAQVESALRNMGKGVREKLRWDTAAGVQQRWRVTYRGDGDVREVMFRGGKVTSVEYQKGG
jgi:hypothetical protein